MYFSNFLGNVATFGFRILIIEKVGSQSLINIWLSEVLKFSRFRGLYIHTPCNNVYFIYLVYLYLYTYVYQLLLTSRVVRVKLWAMPCECVRREISGLRTRTTRSPRRTLATLTCLRRRCRRSTRVTARHWPPTETATGATLSSTSVLVSNSSESH